MTTAPQSLSSPHDPAVAKSGARRHHPGYGRWTPFFFLAPAVLALFAIGIYPTVFAVVTSFRRYNITRRADMLDGFPFVGFDNYRQAFNDQTFWDSLTLTGKFFLCRGAASDRARRADRADAAPAGMGPPARDHPRFARRAAGDDLRRGRPDRPADLQPRLRRGQPVPRLARHRFVRLARQTRPAPSSRSW